MLYGLRAWYHSNKAHDAYKRVEKLRHQKRYIGIYPADSELRRLLETQINDALRTMQAHTARVAILRAQLELKRRS